jgi:hypothetical protein
MLPQAARAASASNLHNVLAIPRAELKRFAGTVSDLTTKDVRAGRVTLPEPAYEPDVP